MYTKINLHALKEVVPPAAFFAGGIVAWYALILLMDVPSFMLPSPGDVLRALAADFPYLLEQLGITLLEAAGGYLLALAASLVAAALFVYSKMLEKGLYPYVVALKITPVLALAPFLVLWFGLGIVSKVVIVALVCFFPLLVTTVRGFKAVDSGQLELFTSLAATPAQIFWKLRLPSSLPYLFAGLKITTVLALTGAFVAEFIAGRSGIGYVIISSTRTFESADAFAGIVLSVVGGLIFFILVSVLERTVVFWQQVDEL